MRGFEQTVLVYDPFVDAEHIARHQAQEATLDDVIPRFFSGARSSVCSHEISFFRQNRVGAHYIHQFQWS
jgi:hypothetical protein